MSLRDSLRAREPMWLPVRPSSPRSRCAAGTGIRALVAGAPLLALVLSGLAAQAAEFERTFSYPADRITVATLVGSVRVEKGSGSEIQVTVQVRGQDADEKWIEFDSETGTNPRLVVQFPLGEHRKYVYPPMGRSSRSSFSPHDGRHSSDNWLEELLDWSSGDKVEVRGSAWSDAIELWTDVIIRVPDSGRLMLSLKSPLKKRLHVQTFQRSNV